MASSRMSPLIPVVALLLMIGAAARVAEAQQIPSCAAKLVPCAEYLNATTKPPSSCCDPLKEAVTKELSCLCSLYENPEFLSIYRINATQALMLPGLCGISGNLDACNITSPAGGPSGSASNTPPATPGGGNNDNNGVDRIVGAGFSSLFLLVASMVLY